MKLIYVAHGYGGDPKNADAAEEWVAELSKHFDAIFWAPWIPMVRNWADSGETRARGLLLDMEAVRKSDEIWFITGMDGAYSQGQELEFRAAKLHNIRCRTFHEDTLDFMLSNEPDSAFSAAKERIANQLATNSATPLDPPVEASPSVPDAANTESSGAETFERNKQ